MQQQSPKRISYLGPEGTFTDYAAHVYAPEDACRVPYPELNLVIGALEGGDVHEAVVPIENSVGGAVIDVNDFLVRSESAKIKGELLVRIEQCLIAPPGTRLQDINAVVSKPEAISQCRVFLDANLPDAARIGTPSTVDAINSVKSGESKRAAIGPRRAAELVGLPVLKENIQDRQNNVTRFVILAKEDHAATGQDKTSLVFSFMDRDVPGQLHLALGPLARRDINLAKIESRPTGEELGSYVFLMDIEGHRTDRQVVEAVDELLEIAPFVKTLGSYPVATKIH